MSASVSFKPVTVRSLAQAKRQGRKFAVLTAYDAAFARLLDRCGVEVVLVGDSLGMVVQGHETTVPVTMDHMVYHTRAVTRACRRALVMADLPFLSAATPEQALRNSARLMQEGGAHMVKLEGGEHQADTIARLSREGIPVCAHIGLQPQSVHKLGGYRVQGRDEQSARQLLDDAQVLAQAGADLMVVESIPVALARAITEQCTIPVIGIGAGPYCDAQVLVLYDLLGLGDHRPRFAKDFLHQGGSLEQAVRDYVTAVAEGSFPGPEHSFQ